MHSDDFFADIRPIRDGSDRDVVAEPVGDCSSPPSVGGFAGGAFAGLAVVGGFAVVGVSTVRAFVPEFAGAGEPIRPVSECGLVCSTASAGGDEGFSPFGFNDFSAVFVNVVVQDFGGVVVNSDVAFASLLVFQGGVAFGTVFDFDEAVFCVNIGEVEAVNGSDSGTTFPHQQ